MKVAVDENVPLSVVRELQERAWDVLDIRGTPKEGLDDEQLWHLVQSEQRLFITTDKGFAHYREEDHSGMVIVTLKHPNSRKIFARVMQALEQYETWEKRLVVMRDTVQSVWIASK